MGDEVIGMFAKRYILTPNLLDVRFEVTKNCNFGCHYCVDHILNYTHPSFETLKRMIDYLLNMDDKIFYLSLIGGEPTTHPDFIKLIEYFLNNISVDRLKKSEISIATNFSKPLSYYNEITKLVKQYQLGQLKFFPSYHRGFIKLDSFIEKYEWALNNNNLAVGAFMIYSEKCLKEYNSFESSDNLKPRPIFGKESILGIKESQEARYKVFEDLKVITKPDNEFVFKDIKLPFDFNFNKFLCYSIKNNIIMSCDGSIYYCMDRCRQGSIGNIFDNKKIDKKYTICNVNQCVCTFGVPKIKLKHFNDFKNLDISFIEGL